MTFPEFDLAAAHRHFSAACFNGVWELIDKPDRSPDDDRKMVSMAHASLYHWQQRLDCTSRSLSIGYWQLSRVYALLGQADNARQYAQLCLSHSQNEEPFYLGYAYESVARAAFLAGHHALGAEGVVQARKQAALVINTAEREMLEKDLQTIRASANRLMPEMTSLEWEVIRKLLIAEIYEAFAHVSRDGGVSWSESEVIDFHGSDEEREAARQKETDNHWSQLVDDENWSTEPGVGGYSFLDSIGFRYYLPPTMIRCVKSGYDLGICFHLSHFGPETEEHRRNQQSLLDDRQRRCIARFIRHMVNWSGQGMNGDSWREALIAGWNQFLEE